MASTESRLQGLLIWPVPVVEGMFVLDSAASVGTVNQPIPRKASPIEQLFTLNNPEKGGQNTREMVLKEELNSVSDGHSAEVEFLRQQIVGKRLRRSGV
ncbi:hypothetical protein R1flu_012640 [Riccia fluitans]|uniref:Uncharacterized protein n=1 Tax=Riccia fluitans TaxID=41844 RepID=A0ABD1ZBF4_9MARC